MVSAAEDAAIACCIKAGFALKPCFDFASCSGPKSGSCLCSSLDSHSCSCACNWTVSFCACSSGSEFCICPCSSACQPSHCCESCAFDSCCLHSSCLCPPM